MKNIENYIPQHINAEICGNTAVFEISSSKIIEFARHLRDDKNLSLKLITATDEREEYGCFKIWYVFGVKKENVFIIPYIKLKNMEEFPSLTSVFHEAWNYERKIQTFFGLKPIGHPDSRMIILHENWPIDVFPLRKDFNWQTKPKLAHNVYNFQNVEGEGIYEIPVGPIHAGIIEPGHFRFTVAGEEIMFLESRLGFTHKGSEKLFEILSLAEKVRLSEKISGDSSFSHSLTFCQTVEQLSGITVQSRVRYLRVIYAELERLANHFGDIGAIMLDAGFNFGGSNGARLREMIMQLNERLTGSRFLRGVNAIGGVTKDINIKEMNVLSSNLTKIYEDFLEVIAVAENSTSLINRLKDTGVLTYEIAKDHGVMGVAGRAVGIPSDARIDYPYAAYDEFSIGEVAIEQSGDVYARFHVRIKEVDASIKVIQQALQKMPEEGVISPVDIVLKKNALAVSIVEGWRGEIVYFVTTDSRGIISRVAVRDPSFINWTALGYAGFGNVVPDFPLINKSFNLSYSGNDL
ncbi:MAG: NADH-quinone oxidoreductase subunit C [Candidatus Firestonebacteria bacterium]